MKQDDILDEALDPIESDESIEKPRRPTAITVVCILGFIGVAFSIPLLLVLAKQLGAWFTGYLTVSTLVSLACMIGLWKMKKWAVFVYLVLVLLNQVVFLNLGAWRITSIVMPALVIGIAFYHLDKMD